MENLQFNQTRFVLIQAAKKLSGKLNRTIRSITSEDYSYDDAQWTAKQTACHIYLSNQYMIKKIQNVIGLLNEGLLNEDSEYFESDLTIVETILNVSVYKIKSLPEYNLPLHYSLEELELKMAVQIMKFIQLAKETPAAFANNYLTQMKVISGIKLDIYQLLYFAIKHTEHHLDQIDAIESTKEILDDLPILKEKDQQFTYS